MSKQKGYIITESELAEREKLYGAAGEEWARWIRGSAFIEVESDTVEAHLGE